MCHRRLILCLFTWVGFSMTATTQPVEIGSRLELMVDDALVDTANGARLVLHRPVEREIAIVFDEPWEGNNCGYVTIFQDGDRYRMYYRGKQLDWSTGELKVPHPEFYCYAESTDGVRWTKPDLNLVEFEGSKENNIILAGLGCHNFAPVRDANPDCKPEEQYKALGSGKGGLVAFKSSDGIHWSLLSDEPVITEGAFDSQNVAFWDPVRGEYREYHRGFRDGRDILTCTSDDFIHWTKPVWLEYSPGRLTQLYTNQIAPYVRAPHIFLGFPTRYIDGRTWLTPLNEAISQVSERFGTDYTDGGFITSRDGLRFNVWDEAFIRPGPQEMGRWVYGDNYQNWGLVETRPADSRAPAELSVYASEGCWAGASVALRRYTLRIDGFASMHASLSGGEFTSRPVVFSGTELVLNLSTSAAGGVCVELQDAIGDPIDGFALADADEVFGDSLERVVKWDGRSDVSALAGKPVRLRFSLRDADLYAFRFR